MPTIEELAQRSPQQWIDEFWDIIEQVKTMPADDVTKFIELVRQYAGGSIPVIVAEILEPYANN